MKQKLFLRFINNRLKPKPLSSQYILMRQMNSLIFCLRLFVSCRKTRFNPNCDVEDFKIEFE